MRKVRSARQAVAGEIIENSTFPRPGMSVGDAGYLGYWSNEEILNFLKELLESERIGAKAFAAIGRVADPHVAELIFESELAQGAICVLLKKEIAARGKAIPLRHEKTTAYPNAECSPRREIGFASSHQARSADRIEDAILNIFDSKLNAKLMYLLLLHRKQVELLEALLKP